ncbi:hypothetical protein AGABI2DRAFT_121882 [Agaricus bisporus var. bisporus H97]|uniref:hypothetical protein n=1 Tax=Agaricus bisporus var. bisporus (strain H97 / ATCC MYA-4626 / FGSC 10389) TaxID=936046 RepID=UPI00029F5758|nr:hypothetical protein AGABI2DRAFT_121882 [Agaricus bisporus var. bisporus H97]EKV42981.1 hypothetical protein AGABI2DRAFT_121882 [Agaricus bisporus var. bisporus H97]
MFGQLLSLLAVIYVIRRAILFRRSARSLGNLPGYRVFVNTNTIYGLFMPKIRGFSQGASSFYLDKHSVYAWAGCDIVAHVSVFPDKVDIFVADANVIKEITTYRARFPKPVDYYDSLSFFGYNVVASEGEAWKKYRKICAPSFSERNNRLVWDEAVMTMNDIFDNAWENKERVVVDNFLDITLPVTLSIISVAGFGHKMTWKGDKIIPQGHQMTFKDSLYIVATHVIPKVVLPEWVMSLSSKTRQIDLGFKELRSYMVGMIETRKNSEKVERHDLFSNLLEANSGDGETETLSADELIGNIFIFLLAGHETTAHTLSYTFALLALYQDEQEKLYQHIKSIVKDFRAPVYSDMPLLTRTLAVFYETLRMFPSVTHIPKRSAEDTLFTIINAKNEMVTVPVPKGTDVSIDVPGLHNNPKYWDDPSTFKPDRFMKPDWNRDAFLPFSGGPRACLGRRFAETESVVVISMLISQYKITVKEEPQFANESFEMRKERLFKSTRLLTLTSPSINKENVTDLQPPVFSQPRTFAFFPAIKYG